jgi:hypothetical protein
VRAVDRARLVAEGQPDDAYGRAVQKAARDLVQAVWQVKDPEARVEAWQVVQRVLKPATTYDFEVKP